MRDLMNLVEASVAIDNQQGIGNIPDSRNIDYFGFRVLMRPSVFLNLAAPLDNPGQSLPFIQQEIAAGKAIAAPFLVIQVPEAWEDDNLSEPAKVRTHEGRHRMVAVKNVFGDDPIEVHLFFADGLRARHIKEEWLAKINENLLKEKSKEVLDGPFFQKL